MTVTELLNIQSVKLIDDGCIIPHHSRNLVLIGSDVAPGRSGPNELLCRSSNQLSSHHLPAHVQIHPPAGVHSLYIRGSDQCQYRILRPQTLGLSSHHWQFAPTCNEVHSFALNWWSLNPNRLGHHRH
jgi:hypothetical protein